MHRACARPLNMPRQVPPERLLVVLDAMKAVQPVLGNRKRIAGLKLVAADGVATLRSRV